MLGLISVCCVVRHAITAYLHCRLTASSELMVLLCNPVLLLSGRLCFVRNFGFKPVSVCNPATCSVYNHSVHIPVNTTVSAWLNCNFTSLN